MDSLRILILIQEYELAEKVSAVIRSANISSISTQVNHLNEGLSLIDSLDLCIIDLDIISDDAQKARLTEVVKIYGKKVKFIFISDGTLDSKLQEQVESLGYDSVLIKPLSVIAAASRISDLFQKEVSGARAERQAEFMGIRITLFRKINIYPCDIFLSLSSRKFVKFANEGERVDLDRIATIKEKGVKELFLTIDDFYKYSELFFTKDLVHPDNVKDSEDYALKSHEALHEMVEDLGVSKHIINVSKQTINKILDDFKSPKFKSLMSRFKNDSNTFIYDHSYLTMVFALEVCNKMDWQSDQVREKICMAAMFHDFGFQDSKLAYFEHQGKESWGDLTPAQRREIEEHPEVMAEMLAGEKNVSMEVIKMIANHHEGAGAESYPKGLPATNMSQLECIFISCHALSLELYNIGFNLQKLPKAFEEVVKKYSSGNFKKPIEALREVILSK